MRGRLTRDMRDLQPPGLVDQPLENPADRLAIQGWDSVTRQSLQYQALPLWVIHGRTRGALEFANPEYQLYPLPQ